MQRYYQSSMMRSKRTDSTTSQVYWPLEVLLAITAVCTACDALLPALVALPKVRMTFCGTLLPAGNDCEFAPPVMRRFPTLVILLGKCACSFQGVLFAGSLHLRQRSGRCV